MPCQDCCPPAFPAESAITCATEEIPLKRASTRAKLKKRISSIHLRRKSLSSLSQIFNAQSAPPVPQIPVPILMPMPTRAAPIPPAFPLSDASPVSTDSDSDSMSFQCTGDSTSDLTIYTNSSTNPSCSNLPEPFVIPTILIFPPPRPRTAGGRVSSYYYPKRASLLQAMPQDVSENYAQVMNFISP